MAINTRERNLNTPSDLQNQSFDGEFGINLVEPVGFDGGSLQRANADNMALKFTEDGSVQYLAVAAPGTSEATAKWKVMKIDNTSGIRITWADGDCNFDNEATDLTSLSYS
jgi:hypothetical protein